MREMKRAGDPRRLGEAPLEAILDYSPAIIHLKDPQGRYLLINRRFEELFKVQRRQTLGKTAHDLFPLGTANVLRNHDQQVLASQGPLEFEEVLPLDGEPHTYISVKFPLLDARGVPYATCGISTDITERKRAEQALKAAVDQLQASHDQLRAAQLQLIQAAKLESLGTLAATVAHEVKNPLQTILMGLDYLERNLPAADAPFPLVLTEMRNAVERANLIVRELVQLSAPTDFQMKDEDVNALVQRCLSLMNCEVLASQTTLVQNLAPDLPPVKLDWRKMEQVLLNLFINALQAMSQGGVLTVTTRLARLADLLPLTGATFPQFAPRDPLVSLEVQDTGTGIAEADLPRIFDPFFTTKPPGVGTGLGLSVVKNIVDLHGGAIHIRNAPPQGALVTLILKARKDKHYDPKQNQ